MVDLNMPSLQTFHEQHKTYWAGQTWGCFISIEDPSSKCHLSEVYDDLFLQLCNEKSIAWIVSNETHRGWTVRTAFRYIFRMYGTLYEAFRIRHTHVCCCYQYALSLGILFCSERMIFLDSDGEKQVCQDLCYGRHHVSRNWVLF